MLTFNDIAKSSDKLIKFVHVATGQRVEFPAFITDFSDSYDVSWGTEQVYGRNDPIKPYQGTTRSISLAFDVVSENIERARQNMANYGKLIQMLYPVYSQPIRHGGVKGRTLKAPPFMRLQFANLITNTSRNSSEKGILGCISGLQFNPNRDSGFFHDGPNLLPKTFNVTFNFDPQHEGELGFDSSGKFLSAKFPYNQLDPETAQGIASQNQNVTQARESDVLGRS